MASVYAIIDKKSGKTYIGQTRNKPEYRFRDHMRDAENGKRHPLHHALRARPDDFVFEVIASVPQSELDSMEKDMILLAGTMHPHGYNLKEGGGDGYKVSDHTREKLRAARANFVFTEETKAKMKAAKNRPEARAAQAAKVRGRKFTKDQYANLLAAWDRPGMRDGARSRMLGKKLPEATKEKIAAAQARWRESKKNAIKPEIKACKKCLVPKPANLDHFGPSKDNYIGMLAVCRECRREAARKK